jgi:hypothetical protein
MPWSSIDIGCERRAGIPQFPLTISAPPASRRLIRVVRWRIALCYRAAKNSHPTNASWALGRRAAQEVEE